MATVTKLGDQHASVVCDKCGSTVSYNYGEAKKHIIGYKGARTFYSWTLKLPCSGHVISIHRASE